MEVIKAQIEEKKHWQGQTVNMWIQVEPESLSEIPETLIIEEGKVNIFVEESKSR